MSISCVGGHCQIIGNELADQAAKAACNLVSSRHTAYLSMKSAKAKIQSGILNYWHKTCFSCTDGYHLKLYQPSVSLKTSINQMSKRKEQINLHHLRLCRSSLNNQGPIHRKECKDTAHFLLYCHRFSAQCHVLNNELEAI